MQALMVASTRIIGIRGAKIIERDGHVYTVEGDWHEIYNVFQQIQHTDENISFKLLINGVWKRILRDYLNEMKVGIVEYTHIEIPDQDSVNVAIQCCDGTIHRYIIYSTARVEEITA